MSPELTQRRFGSNHQTNLRKNLVCLSLHPEVPVVIGESLLRGDNASGSRFGISTRSLGCSMRQSASSEFPEELAASRIVALRIESLKTYFPA